MKQKKLTKIRSLIVYHYRGRDVMCTEKLDFCGKKFLNDLNGLVEDLDHLEFDKHSKCAKLQTSCVA